MILPLSLLNFNYFQFIQKGKMEYLAEHLSLVEIVNDYAFGNFQESSPSFSKETVFLGRFIWHGDNQQDSVVFYFNWSNGKKNSIGIWNYSLKKKKGAFLQTTNTFQFLAFATTKLFTLMFTFWQAVKRVDH